MNEEERAQRRKQVIETMLAGALEKFRDPRFLMGFGSALFLSAFSTFVVWPIASLAGASVVPWLLFLLLAGATLVLVVWAVEAFRRWRINRDAKNAPQE